MLTRKLFPIPLFSLCLSVCSAQTPAVIAGTVCRIDSFVSAFVPPRRVDIWLPANYDTTRRFAVLYIHDGQLIFDSTITAKRQEWGVDETLTMLARAGRIRNTMVVGIWSTGPLRHAEYFPWKPVEVLPAAERDSITRSDFNGTPLSDRYLKFVVQELKPWIDARFSTRTDRANTFIAGSSMGGLISLYAICEYPGVFGGAACLSTHWIGNTGRRDMVIPTAFRNYLRGHLPDPVTHRLYFDHGTIGLDSLYRPGQVMIDDVMTAGGYRLSNWMSVEFAGADHTERDWNRRLAIPMEFLLAEP